MMWQVWKQWPDLAPYHDSDGPTDDELAWYWMQQQIDDGLALCEDCEQWGWGAFCGQCGKPHSGEKQAECPGCSRLVSTRWCVWCGTLVRTEFEERWERGEVDLEDEARRATTLIRTVASRSPRLAALLTGDDDGTAASLAEAVDKALGGRSG